MNIALIDDEPFFREELKKALYSAFSVLGFTADKIDSFSSSKDFFPAWYPGAYDIIFLDIYMDNETGIDLARKIRQTDADSVLIFCTSSNEFAAETYEVRASDYLNKPVSTEKLITMFHRLKLFSIEQKRTICLPDGYRCLLHNIIYTEYRNHTIIFYLKNEPPHSVYMKHSDAEALLLNYKTFKQINKGCIVNLAMVQQIDGNVFAMQNGDLIPISRRRYKEICEAYTRYRFEKMSREVDD